MILDSDDLFEGNKWHSFSDVLLELDLPTKKEDCIKQFERLPASIQLIAFEWGLSDTPFRDEAYVWLRDNPESK